MSSPHSRVLCLGLATSLLVSGCSMFNPYRFAPELDGAKRPVTDPQFEPAGNLGPAMDALDAQRREFWESAGAQARTRNGLAFTLIPLAAILLYRGIQHPGTDASKAIMQKGALFAGAAYTSYSWLASPPKDTIYLNGATALTCLAADYAPLIVESGAFEKFNQDLAAARVALERVYTSRALLYEYRGQSGPLQATYWATQHKVRFATQALNTAGALAGTINSAGARLRANTSAVAGAVAREIDKNEPEISSLKNLIAGLPSLSNELAGLPVLPVDADGAGAGNADTPTNGVTTGDPAQNGAAGTTSATCKPADAASADPEAAKANADATQAAENAKTKAEAADKAEDKSAKAKAELEALATDKAKPAELAQAKKDAAAAKTEADKARQEANVAKLNAGVKAQAAEAKSRSAFRRNPTRPTYGMSEPIVQQTVREARGNLDELNESLGPVLAFISAIQEARKVNTVPPTCEVEKKPIVAVVPAINAITLGPNETYSFVLNGETGRPQAYFSGNTPDHGALWINMPGDTAKATVQLRTGTKIDGALKAQLVINDSSARALLAVAVTVCPK